MSTQTLFDAIENLSVEDKLILVEKTIHSLREQQPNVLSIAAVAMAMEYTTNKELTIFSSLDMEDFYEPR